MFGMNGGDPLSRPGRHTCRPTDEWPAALGVQLNTHPAYLSDCAFIAMKFVPKS